MQCFFRFGKNSKGKEVCQSYQVGSDALNVRLGLTLR